MHLAITLSCLLLILHHASDGVPVNKDTRILRAGRHRKTTRTYQPTSAEKDEISPAVHQAPTSADWGDPQLKLPAEHREYVVAHPCHDDGTGDCRNATGTGDQNAPTAPTFAHQIVPTSANRTAQTRPAENYTFLASEDIVRVSPDVSDRSKLTANEETKTDGARSSISPNETIPVDDHEAALSMGVQSSKASKHRTSLASDTLDVVGDNQTASTISDHNDLGQTRRTSERRRPHGNMTDDGHPSTGTSTDEKDRLTLVFDDNTPHVDQLKVGRNTSNETSPAVDHVVDLDGDNTTELARTRLNANTSDSQVAEKEEEDEDTIHEDERNPEVRPGLFEGDMVLDTEDDNELWRVGLRRDVHQKRLWTNNTVPYVISPLYAPEDYVTIYKAITSFNFMTCVKFVPWDGKAKDYVLIWPVKYPKGCWSHVGRRGGVQMVSLQPPDQRSRNCLGGEGRAIHELMHTLGIFHEHARADRDNFVQIHHDNICKGYKKNFKKQSLENTTYAFEYDYNSIMHYGKYFFRL